MAGGGSGMGRATARELAGRGAVVAVLDLPGSKGQDTAAKAGIAGMSLTMARDLGSLGIRVLAIAPSLFATGLLEQAPEELVLQLTRDAAFPRRPGRPEEYAWLAEAIIRNPMLNGQTI